MGIFAQQFNPSTLKAKYNASTLKAQTVTSVDCNDCEPALWADGETPISVTAVVAGITNGAAWHGGCPDSSLLNGTFELVQNFTPWPCRFIYYSTYAVYVWWADGGAAGACFGTSQDFGVSLIEPYGTDCGNWCVFADAGTCKVSFTNQITEPPNRHYINGTAEVSW